MAVRYSLTPNEIAALRALNEGIVEMSDAEVAARSLLLPNKARTALGHLERRGFVSSWAPVTGRTGEHLYVVNEPGRNIYRALQSFKGTPPIGSVVQIRNPLLGLSHEEYVEITPDEEHVGQS